MRCVWKWLKIVIIVRYYETVSINFRIPYILFSSDQIELIVYLFMFVTFCIPFTLLIFTLSVLFFFCSYTVSFLYFLCVLLCVDLHFVCGSCLIISLLSFMISYCIGSISIQIPILILGLVLICICMWIASFSISVCISKYNPLFLWRCAIDMVSFWSLSFFLLFYRDSWFLCISVDVCVCAQMCICFLFYLIFI